MENRVVSLEIAEKMSLSGFEKETEFYWVFGGKDKPQVVPKNQKNFFTARMDRVVIPAPISDEILEEMPIGTEIYKSAKGYEVSLLGSRSKRIIDGNLADALGLLYLNRNTQLTKR